MYIKVIFVALFAVLLVLIFPRIQKLWGFMDFGESVFDHKPGPCVQVKGAVNGSEDMELLPGTDIALISNGLRYDKINNYKERQGKILYFDFSKPENGINHVIIKNFPKSLEEFNAHGISVWTQYEKVRVKDDCEDQNERCQEWAKAYECQKNHVYMQANCQESCKLCDGKKPVKYYLFVVNHEKLLTCVEKFVFDVDSKTLTHIESIVDQQGFGYINDIAATGEHSFYFTNYMSTVPGTWMASVENWLMLRWASLGFYDGEKTVIEDTDMLMPNGIILSPDKQHLYMVNAADHNIKVYEIQENQSLNLVQVKDIDTHMDNINVERVTGDLWLGCNPVGWKVVKHILEDPSFPSPSQVIRVKVENGLLTDDMQELFVDSGHMISGSSVAIYHQNTLLIGSMGHTTVHCQVYNID